MLSDFHVHTRFSGDSEADPEAILDHAVSMGMQHICFTDHQDFDYQYETDFNLPAEAYWAYMPELRDRRAGQIAVSIGVETGLEVPMGADVDVSPMNLQNVFVALCGHGDAQ